VWRLFLDEPELHRDGIGWDNDGWDNDGWRVGWRRDRRDVERRRRGVDGWRTLGRRVDGGRVVGWRIFRWRIR
jgi:hypothetical protein